MRYLSSLASQLRSTIGHNSQWTLPPSPSLRFSSCLIPQSNSNLLLIGFLRDNGFDNPDAISIASRSPNIKSLEQPRSVIQLLKTHDFSDTQIQKLIRVRPQFMFCNSDNILQPKLRFFQELGFSGSSLGQLLSKNSSLFAASLEKKLIPCAQILKTIVNSKDLTLILTRCTWLLSRDPDSFLLPNISSLKSFGLVDSQLVSLLKRRPGIFILPEKKLKSHLSFAMELGFCVHSGMMVLAIISLSCISKQTIDRKLQVFVANGFSKKETREMIRKSPGLIRCAEDKLKRAMKLYMETMGIKREALVRRPCVLMHSLDKRVIPRLKVLQVLKDKGLLKEIDDMKKKKKCSLIEIVSISEMEFMDKYVLSFGEDEKGEELMVAYKGHLLNTSCS
ncbi:unnamed protein product [Cochlearia groenlandica]